MEDMETELLRRYFGKTKAYPDGRVLHHGDCDFFNIKVCTCGLLHFLMACEPTLLEQHYPLFLKEQGDYEKVRESLLQGHDGPKGK